MQKKSNVLDKPVSHHKSSTTVGPTGAGGAAVPAAAAADIDVKKLTVLMIVVLKLHCRHT